jgi:tetratricopeptide (TPR) repeat protein
LDSANIIYLKLLVQDKDNYDLRYKLALNYEYLGNLNLSLDYLKSIEDKYGESKDLILEKSRILTKNKDYDSALKELLKVLAIDNEDVTVLGLMAELYREIGKIDSAWVYYKRIYPKYASDPFVTISFAEFLLNIGSYDKGKEILISLIYNDTINSDVRDGLFFSLYNEEKRYILYKPLLDTLLSAYHEVSNNNLRSLSIISDLYFKTEKYFKASTLLKEIIDLDKNNYAAYEQIIYCFNSLHFTDSVLKYAGVSLVQFPLRPLAYLYYGSACFEKKDYVNGCNILEKGLKYSDNESLLLDFYNLLGEGYNKLNNFTKSDEYFEKALRNSDNSIIRNNYAYYLSIRKEKLDIALEMSKYTLMRDAKNPIFLDTYGWIFYQLGNLQKAKSYIKKALKNGGNRNGEIWLHYGDVLHDLNKNFGAEKAWEISLMYIGEDKKNEVRTRLNTLK